MSTARRAGRGKGHTMVAAVAVIAAACAVLAVPAPVGAESAGATTRAIGTSARLSLGSVFACAVLDSGQVTCWGRGQYGRLGNGSEATIGDDDTLRDGTPVTMPGGARAVAVTSGFAHACALLDTGDVTCWGLNNLGQLGRGDGTWIGDDETITAGGTTVAFPGGQKAVAIAAGEGHTCAVLADGAVSCWGYGGYGSLGYGNTNSIGDDESVECADQR